MEMHGNDETYIVAIAWVKHDRYYYPRKVVAVDNIPNNIRKNVPTTAEKYFILWYGESNYSAIQPHIVELLRRNRI